MKRKLLLLAVLIMTATISSAQTFGSGDKVLTAQIGLGSSYGLPIAVAYEVGVVDLGSNFAIGVGATAGYASKSENDYKYSNLLLGALGNFHYVGLNKWDFTAGLVLGYDIASAKWTGTGTEIGTDSASGLLLGLNVGAKYYITESLGIAANVGMGIATCQLGIAYKF
ncbi:MAG: hypothetical protein R3Y04_00750 [Rikenellaceae bacterium]